MDFTGRTREYTQKTLHKPTHTGVGTDTQLSKEKKDSVIPEHARKHTSQRPNFISASYANITGQKN